MAGGNYYKEFNIVNTDYTDSPTIHLDFIAPKILIVLDATLTDIEWSYNGRDTEGKMKGTDETMVVAGATVNKIWIKANVVTGTLVRVWAGNGAEELEFLKKIKMITGTTGNILAINPDGSININLIDSISADTVDVSSDWVAINPAGYTEIIKLDADDLLKKFLKEICISLTGHSANFKMELFDGSSIIKKRHYHLNYQNPSFTEMLGNAWPLEPAAGSPYIKISAKMNWQNQLGHASASLNGFK